MTACGPQRRKSRSARTSAIEGISGLVLLVLSSSGCVTQLGRSSAGCPRLWARRMARADTTKTARLQLHGSRRLKQSISDPPRLSEAFENTFSAGGQLLDLARLPRLSVPSEDVLAEHAGEFVAALSSGPMHLKVPSNSDKGASFPIVIRKICFIVETTSPT
jgi:hypothetical protein